MRSVLIAFMLAAATFVAQEKRPTASNGWLKTPAAGETQTTAFVTIENPGMYEVNVTSAKSDAALVEFMKELRGIGGARSVTEDELTTAKDSLIQRLPGTFASVQSINSALVTLWTQGLPDNYYQQYATRISDIRKEDVLRVAKQYIDLDHLTIVIVGDRASIEAPLKAAGVAPIVLTDIEGNVR